MPYTEPHILLTVGGDSYLQTEAWQFGVRCRATPVSDVLDLDSFVNALAAPTEVFFKEAQVGISSAARLTYIKAAYILETGLYPPEGLPAIYTYPIPVPGPSSGIAIPQATLAMTLYTNFPRGRASRGRFFMPPVVPTLGTDGRITAPIADFIEGQAKIWLNAIRSTAQASEILVMSKLGTGRTGVVNRIGCGRVVDTMRSRRRSLLEARTPILL